MCTLTWNTGPRRFSVFFNRDERHHRAEAHPPAYQPQLNAIMPLDPESGGTWIAVHRSGLVLCLLNNYQAEPCTAHPSSLVSRGHIIPHILEHARKSEIMRCLNKLDLSRFQGFRLCTFSRDPLSVNVHTYLWNGRVLTKEEPTQPITSSALTAGETIQSRTQLWKRWSAEKTVDLALHLKYHSSHLPQKGGLSVCMHRNDAHTHSLSRIDVGDRIGFSYLPGSPCTGGAWATTHFSTAPD